MSIVLLAIYFKYIVSLLLNEITPGQEEGFVRPFVNKLWEGKLQTFHLFTRLFEVWHPISALACFFNFKIMVWNMSRMSALRYFVSGYSQCSIMSQVYQSLNVLGLICVIPTKHTGTASRRPLC